MADIERDDSVTIDGCKHLFVPMGSGVWLLKNPEQYRLMAETANYIIRKGSLDADRFTLEGSRPGNVIYMHANIKYLVSDGFEMNVNRIARICKHMADALEATGLFEFVSEPMMNILLYRCVPVWLRHKMFGETEVRGTYFRFAHDASIRSEVFIHDVVECSCEGGHAVTTLVSGSSAFERRCECLSDGD